MTRLIQHLIGLIVGSPSLEVETLAKTSSFGSIPAFDRCAKLRLCTRRYNNIGKAVDQFLHTNIINKTIVQLLTRWMKKSSILSSGVEGGGAAVEVHFTVGSAHRIRDRRKERVVAW